VSATTGAELLHRPAIRGNCHRHQNTMSPTSGCAPVASSRPPAKGSPYGSGLGIELRFAGDRVMPSSRILVSWANFSSSPRCKSFRVARRGGRGWWSRPSTGVICRAIGSGLGIESRFAGDRVMPSSQMSGTQANFPSSPRCKSFRAARRGDKGWWGYPSTGTICRAIGREQGRH
jgi:hypothetical protein